MTQVGKTSVCIYETSIDTFLGTVRQNIDKYYHLRMFWLPIIEKRAECLLDSAEDCLLNPIFRWCYLNTREKLTALEQELEAVNNVLGHDALVNYQKIIMADMVTCPTENQAHDRMLDARAEIRGMLHYANLSCCIVLEARQPSKKTHDFNAISANSNVAVESKFIRYPDKLGQYLMRWWQAQAEISGVRPLGYMPYIKFKWEDVNRDELSFEEIAEVKRFFRLVFDEPNLDKKLSLERIRIMYSPANRLAPATTPLGVIEQNTEHSVEPLIKKIRGTIEKAQIQLDMARKKGMDTTCYLLLNLKPDIAFYWRKVFNNRLTDLKNEYSRYGLKILTEEVAYL